MLALPSPAVAMLMVGTLGAVTVDEEELALKFVPDGVELPPPLHAANNPVNNAAVIDK
jgi:hypothetical protein